METKHLKDGTVKGSGAAQGGSRWTYAGSAARVPGRPAAQRSGAAASVPIEVRIRSHILLRTPISFYQTTCDRFPAH
jgi:hypothetical protein